ncbi:hypothetical protein LOZ51_001300 [Ophidiomyces ophidiicola]|nr:hypothetical protein LOZ55_005513 [Ophidiomyces ophidiicola]KAI1989926.1 hypothetical protein LOZ54_002721 [Ophidiomyces ophidiicola]KAI2001009.1 hypothetical protein LOZ51_001300 [Ophidiomyces ophidiicola]
MEQPQCLKKSPMKAKRRGLSLGAGVRAGLSRSAEMTLIHGTDCVEIPGPQISLEMAAPTKVQHRRPGELVSPEEDDPNESDLDTRTQLLLDRFTSHHSPAKNSTGKTTASDNMSDLPAKQVQGRSGCLPGHTKSSTNPQESSSKAKRLEHYSPVQTASAGIPKRSKRPTGMSAVKQYVPPIQKGSSDSNGLGAKSLKQSPSNVKQTTLPLSPTVTRKAKKSGLLPGTSSNTQTKTLKPNGRPKNILSRKPGQLNNKKAMGLASRPTPKTTRKDPWRAYVPSSSDQPSKFTPSSINTNQPRKNLPAPLQQYGRPACASSSSDGDEIIFLSPLSSPDALSSSIAPLSSAPIPSSSSTASRLSKAPRLPNNEIVKPRNTPMLTPSMTSSDGPNPNDLPTLSDMRKLDITPSKKQGLLLKSPSCSLLGVNGMSSKSGNVNCTSVSKLREKIQPSESQQRERQIVSSPTNNVSLDNENTLKFITKQKTSASSKTNNTPVSFPNLPQTIRSPLNSPHLNKKPSFQNRIFHNSSTTSLQKAPKAAKDGLMAPNFNDKGQRGEPEVRRSGRSRRGPSNYYAPPQGYSSRRFTQEIIYLDSDEQEEPSPEPIIDSHSPPNSPMSPIPSCHKVIFQSDDFHITQEPLISGTPSDISEEIGKAHIPYHRQKTRNNLSSFCRMRGIVHVDFDFSEMHAVYTFLTGGNSTLEDDTPIQTLVSDALRQYESGGKDGGQLNIDCLFNVADLQHRGPKAIHRFLEDAKEGALNSFPSKLRVLAGTPNHHINFDSSNLQALLRSRELGYSVHRNRTRISRRLEDLKKWEKWKSWTGASSDVLVLAWSPDSTRFAAAAAAQTDEHSMRYNRNNNLLLGNLCSSKLKELPDHCIDRPIPESGPNSYETYVMVDPKLYMTVNSLHWTNCGNRLYSASFDKTVKLWDVTSHNNATCINTFSHPERVRELAVSPFDSQLVATGCDGPNFFLWRADDNSGFSPIRLDFQREKRVKMTPSALQWSAYSRILAGGLTGEDDSDHDPSKHGHLTLWRVDEASTTPLKVLPNSQNIFDLAWHPTLPMLATGNTLVSSRGIGIGRDARSAVRIYDPLRIRFPTQSYESPALDINKVTFCPSNDTYITASCTDGATYVWDSRNPSQILHKMKHGEPIHRDRFPDLTREQSDFGVSFALWEKGFEFYTGATDGVLKRWDVRRGTEDVLQENVASFNQELMCASISPDHANMVLGDAAGGIHVISTAPWGHSEENFSTFELERASVIEAEKPADEGRSAAAELLLSGKLTRHPIFGPGKGPNYDGPYARWARPQNTEPDKLAFTPLIPEVQATQLDGLPPRDRRGLDKKTRKRLYKLIELSTIRNQKVGKNKRKRDSSTFSRSSNSIRAASTPSPSPKKPVISGFNSTSSRHVSRDVTATPVSRRHRPTVEPFKIDPNNFVDLTIDSDEDGPMQEAETTEWDTTEAEDTLEEDYWWPVNVDPNLNSRSS